jgi:hypothetical protein
VRRTAQPFGGIGVQGVGGHAGRLRVVADGGGIEQRGLVAVDEIASADSVHRGEAAGSTEAAAPRSAVRRGP